MGAKRMPSHLPRPIGADQSTVALYRFGRSCAEHVVRDAGGSGLDLVLEGAFLGSGALQLPGRPGARAICRDTRRIAKALRGASGMTVEMWLSSGSSFMDYRPREEEGEAPSSLGHHWGDVIFCQADEDCEHPLGARLRYNPDMLFWTGVAANGLEHARGPWFRAVGYLPGKLARGSWHYLAFAWEEDAVRLYVDGVELATGNSPGFRPPPGPIIIGCDSDGGYPFKGAIRELRISRIARPRRYFKRMFPEKERVMRLPELQLAGAQRDLTACLPPRHKDEYLLPLTKVRAPGRRRRLSMWAAAGQVENATFAVRSSRPLTRLIAIPTDLDSADDTIPADRIDIKVVKCVYHTWEAPVPANMVPHQSGKKLVPKLLVKDDALVRVDLRKETNAVRVYDAAGRARYYDTTSHNPALAGDRDIRDAETLQPLKLKSGLWQQFWITVRVPEDAKAGRYRGGIELSGRRLSARVELELDVLPIRLADPVLDYSIYYMSRLVNEKKLTAAERARGFSLQPGASLFAHQIERHLQDMKAHGVVNPTIAQDVATPAEVLRLIKRRLAIRGKVGMSSKRLYCLVHLAGGMSAGDRAKFLAGLRALARSFGYRDVACYVVDEPTLADLNEHADVFRQVRAAGVKTFTAIDRLYDEDALQNSALWRKTKECVSILVAAGELRPKLAAAAHAAGMEIYSYANPQALATNPGTFRRNYGLALWKAGYDGAMDFAYNCSYGLSPWNDFDCVLTSDYRYRNDIGFAVTTSNGAVGSLAWEGFAAAVNDVRYVSTLTREIKKAKRAGRLPQARKAQRLLDTLNPGLDLDRTRRRIAQMITSISVPLR